MMRRKPNPGKQSGNALCKQHSAILLAFFLFVAQISYFAPPIYAAITNSKPNFIQRFFERLFTPTVSPVPEPKKNDSKKPSVLSEDDVITPKAQPLDLSDLENRIAFLENQLISQTTNVTAIPTSTLDISTGTNLIRNSSFESSRGNKSRQWNYIYDSTTENTKQSPEGIRSGKYGLKFQGATLSNGQGIDLGISQPETETTPQRTYTLSVYVKHTNVNNDTDVRKPTSANNTTIRLGFWDKYNNKPGRMKTVSLSGTKDWYRISTTVNTTGLITDYANWYPIIEVRGLKEGAAVYIDDVQLVEGSVLTLYNSSQANWSSIGSSLGDGSILATTTGTLYPAEDGIGSLGTTSNRWRDLYLSKATINENGDLDLEGSASINGSLTVNGDSTFKGDVNFTALSTFTNGITVGSDGQFSINSSGDITKIKGISYWFPTTQGAANSFLMNDGAGGLSWGTLGAASVTPDSLDFAQFVDAMTVDATTTVDLDTNSADLNFDNGTLYIDNAGFVGIGTTAPGYKLDVWGNLNLSSGSTLKINGADVLSSSALGPGITGSSLTSVGTLTTGTWNASTIGVPYGGTGTTALASGYLVKGNGTSALSSSVIYDNGTNVGIGTTSPASALDVAGTAWLRGASDGTSGLFVNSSGNVGIGTTAPGSRLHIVGSGTNGANNNLYLDRYNTGASVPTLGIRRARGSLSSPSAVQSNDSLGQLVFMGLHDGLAFGGNNTKVEGLAMENWTSSAQGSALRFATTPIGSSLGLERVRITSSGNVGIGEINPGSKLSVSGGATIGALYDTTAAPTNGLIVEGNVGIGTTAPAYKLDVVGTARVIPSLGSSSGLFVDASGNIGIGTTSPASALDVAGTAWLRGAAGGTSGLFVNASGNVGIGTIAPGALLDVSTGTNAYTRISGNGSITLRNMANQQTITIGSGGNSIKFSSGINAVQFGAESSAYLGDFDVGAAAINGLRGYQNGFRIRSTDNSAGSILSVINGDNTTFLRINNHNGNVGIGTTNPAYKLDVNGDINTTGDILNNGAAYTHPDYVFEPDYDLMSLESLKTYVSTNKHLPGVPSSEDVRRDGVKLFEQTRLNLEKTEEAYLYLFELDDRLNELSLSLPQQPSETATLAIVEDFELDMVALNAELEAVKDQMLTLDERLTLVEEQTDEIASMSAALKELKAEVELLKSTQTVASVSATLAESDLQITDGEETVLENLTVTGKANVFDLAVLKSISTGLLNINGLVCENQDTCHATIATLNGTLALQPEATGNLEFMAGKVVIDTNGDVKIDGKLTVEEIETEKVKTESVVLGEDVTMTSGTTPPTGACQTGAMYVWNDKVKDEAHIFVCTKKKWQAVSTHNAAISVTPTPTPSDVTQDSHIPSSGTSESGAATLPASQTE